MAYDITLGRTEKDRQKFGKEGTIFLGKQYVKMGQTSSLSNEVYVDVARSHVIFVCGKRGSGKSYTLGILAEGMAMLPQEIAENIAVLILDTMGIYWTMKYPNKKDEQLLQQWGVKSMPIGVVVYTPVGYYDKFKKQGIPTDYPFSIKPSELSSSDWCLSFDIEQNSPLGVFIESIIVEFQDEKKDYSIEDILAKIKSSEKVSQDVKNAADNRFSSAMRWGLFSTEGTPMEKLIHAGQITVLDVSCYAMIPGAEGLKSLAIGLVAQKLFLSRMESRKTEEFNAIKKEMSYLLQPETAEKPVEPLVWIIIDEAHEFLPREGRTSASNSLITILREGRQPGISLILATQQPGKIHTDVMTQSDIVISHRLTAKLDVDSLSTLMQSYMREGLDKLLNILPETSGAALVFDDTNERIFPIQTRPRITWHGGGSPTAIPEKKKLFEF